MVENRMVENIGW